MGDDEESGYPGTLDGVLQLGQSTVVRRPKVPKSRRHFVPIFRIQTWQTLDDISSGS